jgi:hypothetical protein
MPKFDFDQTTLDQLAVIYAHEQESSNYTETPDGKGWLQKTALMNRVESEVSDLLTEFGSARGFVVALVNYMAENKLIKAAEVVDESSELSFMDRLEGAAL